MSDDKPTFQVTLEDCDRWQKRLQKMAQTLRDKGGKDNEDGAKMFITAAVLMRQLSLDIQREDMLDGTLSPLGKTTIGEA